MRLCNNCSSSSRDGGSSNGSSSSSRDGGRSGNSEVIEDKAFCLNRHGCWTDSVTCFEFVIYECSKRAEVICTASEYVTSSVADREHKRANNKKT